MKSDKHYGGVFIMLTDNEKAIVKTLRLQNKGYKEIADIIGRTKQEVRGYCSRNNLIGFRANDYYGNQGDREKEFKELFERLYTDYEYHSGFINRDSMFKCKCKKCGHTQERMAYYVQPSKADYNIVCEGCNEIKKLKQSLVDLLVRRHNDLIREHNRTIRENELEEQMKIREKLLANHVCYECGIVFKASSLGNKYCSIECSNKRKNRIKEINRRTKLKENGSVDWSISLNKLIKRDINICHICGSKCNKNDYAIDTNGHFIVGANYPSIDHVLPVSKGGTHTWGNIKLAHHYCNTIKSNNKVYEDNKGQLKMSV